MQDAPEPSQDLFNFLKKCSIRDQRVLGKQAAIWRTQIAQFTSLLTVNQGWQNTACEPICPTTCFFVCDNLQAKNGF